MIVVVVISEGCASISCNFLLARRGERGESTFYDTALLPPKAEGLDVGIIDHNTTTTAVTLVAGIG